MFLAVVVECVEVTLPTVVVFWIVTKTVTAVVLVARGDVVVDAMADSSVGT